MENNQIEQQNFFIDESKFPLENERFIYRKWTKDDLRDLFELMGQEEVMSAIDSTPLKTIEEARSSLNIILSWYEKMYKYELAIFCKKDRKVIGTIGIKLKNVSNNVIEIGYLLNKDYWNQGIMTESMYIMINYIRSISKSVRVICECNINNAASKKVIEKSKMKFCKSVERDNLNFEVYEL